MKHIHLKENEQEECIALLKDSGYTIVKQSADTCAFSSSSKIKIGILFRLCRKILRKLSLLICRKGNCCGDIV